MERGSSKHGPRLDEEMSREVSGTLQGIAGSRAEEWRQAEPPGEDQPQPTVAPNSETGDFRTGTPKGMTPGQVEQRSRLARYLSVSALPGDRETLLRNAEENEAPSDVLTQLQQLPSGIQYRTVSEVWAALGHMNEPQRR
ncbi:MAG TPA: DUF2795 domain-containing protein [Micromonosporaceae bacterium]|nr:DUF2795 domain-containing protein [Micromonosporaceae bacterium]